MTEITQTEVAKKAGMKRATLGRLLSGGIKLRRKTAKKVEAKTGISRFILMDGTASEIREAFERVYGPINFGRGRPRKETK